VTDRTGARRADPRYAGPTDPALREQWRRDRRALVRRHHPDAGGDALRLQDHLAALDRRYRFLERPGGSEPRRRRIARRVLRALRRRHYVEI
jgi:hypothetical protein